MKALVYVTRLSRPAVENVLWYSHRYCPMFVNAVMISLPSTHCTVHVVFKHFVFITLRTNDLLLTGCYVSPLPPIAELPTCHFQKSIIELKKPYFEVKKIIFARGARITSAKSFRPGSRARLRALEAHGF